MRSKAWSCHRVDVGTALNLTFKARRGFGGELGDDGNGAGPAGKRFAGQLCLGAGAIRRNARSLVVIATEILAAAGFVALSEPWEAGAILIAFAPLGMGMFAGAVWTLWKVTSTSSRPTDLAAPARLQPALRQVAPVSLFERLRARLRFI